MFRGEMRAHGALFAVVLILLLVTALTVPFMSVALWTDEMATLRQVGAMPHFGPLNYVDLLANLATGNPWHAPGYFTLLYGWGHIAGWEPFVLRVFSLFCGLLALAFTYNLARHYFSPEVGVYTVFTVGVGYFYMYYMRDMRPYGLLVLMMSVCLWLYERVTRANSRQRLWYTLFTLSVAGLLYTHYFTVFGLAALGLWHLIFQFRKPRYWQTLACFVIGGVMFLPWFPVLRSPVLNGTDAPIEPINPVPCFYASVTRKTLAGTPDGGYEPSQRMTREQALKSYTLDAAYGAFLDHQRGSIEVGKKADFTWFDQDLLMVPESDMLKTQVLGTMVGGEWKYRRSEDLEN